MTSRTKLDPPSSAVLRDSVSQVVDAQGLRCPMPLLKAKLALNTLTEGESVMVLATDAGSVRDFHSFAKLSGHLMQYFNEDEGLYTYILEKYSNTKAVSSGQGHD